MYEDDISPFRGFLWHQGTVTQIEVPDAVDILPQAINPRGQVVGWYFEASDHTPARGFLWHQGRVTRIDIPNAEDRENFAETRATDINPAGQVVGTYDTVDEESNLTTHGFLWHQGRVTQIDVPNARSTYPAAINPAGQIVGEYVDRNDMVRGFVWHRGRVTRIEVPGAVVTSARDINPRGQVVRLLQR